MDGGEMLNRYLRTVKHYGVVLGLWPFHASWKNRVAAGSVYLWCTVAMITMIMWVVINFSFDVMADQLPHICTCVIMVVKHGNTYIKQSQFQEILINMKNDWLAEKTKEELDILIKYAKKGVFYVLLYKINTYFGVTAYIMIPIVPRFLDIVWPLNESRPRLYPYHGYYYVNPDDYYYYILSFTNMSLILAGIVLISADIFMIHFVQHACSLFLIAGYRFQQAANVTAYQMEKEFYQLRNSSYKRLRFAFQSHNRAIEHLGAIESSYDMNLVMQLFIMTLLISITLFEVTVQNSGLDACRLYAFLIAQLLHLLFLTIQGQFILDVHDAVYNMIYESLWYNEPSNLQLLYVVALRRSLTPPVLTAGGLIRLDLNSFAEVIKACMSYYTVLRSR